MIFRAQQFRNGLSRASDGWVWLRVDGSVCCSGEGDHEETHFSVGATLVVAPQRLREVT
jgi:hypothetical protein